MTSPPPPPLTPNPNDFFSRLVMHRVHWTMEYDQLDAISRVTHSTIHSQNGCEIKSPIRMHTARRRMHTARQPRFLRSFHFIPVENALHTLPAAIFCVNFLFSFILCDFFRSALPRPYHIKHKHRTSPKNTRGTPHKCGHKNSEKK